MRAKGVFYFFPSWVRARELALRDQEFGAEPVTVQEKPKRGGKRGRSAGLFGPGPPVQEAGGCVLPLWGLSAARTEGAMAVFLNKDWCRRERVYEKGQQRETEGGKEETG